MIVVVVVVAVVVVIVIVVVVVVVAAVAAVAAVVVVAWCKRIQGPAPGPSEGQATRPQSSQSLKIIKKL